MKNPLEREIRAEITDNLRALGCRVWATSDSRASRNTRGTPDLIVSLGNGVGLLLEVKRPKGAKESDEQTVQSLLGHVVTVTSAEEAILAWQKARKGMKHA